MSEPPQRFLNYAAVVRTAVAQEQAKGRRTLLTSRVASDAADTAEKTDEFRALAAELLPSRSGPNHVSEILRRRGFYQEVEKGSADEALWALVEPYTKKRKAAWNTIMMLDGCVFPRITFPFVGHTIVKLSDVERAALHPPLETLPHFEALTSSFDDRWSLVFSEEREVSPTQFFYAFGERQWFLNRHWTPLFGLALFQMNCFHVPKVFSGEPGYCLLHHRNESVRVDISPDGEEIPAAHYSIKENDWARFDGYLRFFQEAIPRIEKWQPLRLAARRYLRATFMSEPHGDVWEEDDKEDVLLQYVFGLESLLLSDSSREGNTDKFATRVALLIGKDDDQRGEIFKFAKAAYSGRSTLAHGAIPNDSLTIWKLREVFRFVALVVLELNRARSEPAQLTSVIANLATSDALRAEAAAAREKILTMVDQPLI